MIINLLNIIAMSGYFIQTKYVDSDKLPISFTTLVVNVKSMPSDLDIKTLSAKSKLNWVTNGRLLTLTEMGSVPKMIYRLLDWISEYCPLRENMDYVIIQEQMREGVGGRMNPLIGKELPETKNVDWLNSKMTMDGCFVWAKSPLLENKEANTFQLL